MAYFKFLNENGFISICTLNSYNEGNITKQEYDLLSEMFQNAEDGFGIKETTDGFIYVKHEIVEEPTIEEKAEAYDVLIGENE